MLNLPIQLTPVWCIALSYLESYGHYLTTDPAHTGDSSNHVTGNVDIWSHFQQFFRRNARSVLCVPGSKHQENGQRDRNLHAHGGARFVGRDL